MNKNIILSLIMFPNKIFISHADLLSLDIFKPKINYNFVSIGELQSVRDIPILDYNIIHLAFG